MFADIIIGLAEDYLTMYREYSINEDSKWWLVYRDKKFSADRRKEFETFFSDLEDIKKKDDLCDKDIKNRMIDVVRSFNDQVLISKDDASLKGKDGYVIGDGKLPKFISRLNLHIEEVYDLFSEHQLIDIGQQLKNDAVCILKKEMCLFIARMNIEDKVSRGGMFKQMKQWFESELLRSNKRMLAKNICTNVSSDYPRETYQYDSQILQQIDGCEKEHINLLTSNGYRVEFKLGVMVVFRLSFFGFRVEHSPGVFGIYLTQAREQIEELKKKHELLRSTALRPTSSDLFYSGASAAAAASSPSESPRDTILACEADRLLDARIRREKDSKSLGN